MNTNWQEYCGNVSYQKDHDLGEAKAHEERGVLVITHGKRTGRIYATEHSWTERTCKSCGYVRTSETTRQSNEWPSI